MMDTERELFKLGIPAKTRHNEVAPGQFEIAPMFERAQRRRRPPAAADDDVQAAAPTSTAWSACSTRSRSQGINGSGKHVNFSLGNSTEGNLLLPGDTPHENAQFLVFCAAVIRAVHKYGGLLRASVASAQQRPPPRRQRGSAGDHLDLPRRPARRRLRPDRQGRRDVVEGEGHADDRRRHAAGAADRPGRPQPHQPVRLHRQPVRVPRARARCSRSPGRWSRSTRSWPSRSTTSPPSWRRLSRRAPTSTSRCRRCSRRSSPSTARRCSTATATPSDWQIEAAQRGLPNLRTTLDALPELITEAVDGAVQQVRRLHPPRDAQPLRDRPRAVRAQRRRRGPLDAGDRHDVVLPAAVRYQTELALNLGALKAAGVEVDTAPLDDGLGADRHLRSALGDAERRAGCRRGLDAARQRRSTPATRCCRRWPRCARRPTSSKASSPTTSGRCRPTRRCSSSCEVFLRAADVSAVDRICERRRSSAAHCRGRDGRSRAVLHP